MASELLVRAVHTRTPTGNKVSANSTWSVLLCLCEHANKETLLCWPSHKRIKSTTQMGGDAVNRALVCLEENGFITKQRTQAANRYLINKSKLQDLTNGIPDIDSQNLESRPSVPQIPTIREEPVIKPVNEPVMKPVRKQTPKSKPNKPIDDDFEITQKMSDWFSKKGFSFCIDEETQKFINHHIAKGSKFVEPQRAWQNWMMNKFTPNNKKPTAKAENFNSYGETQF
tara:strand:- start:4015 stop:4698 length:684 start_codon:yes stop_codon:yes gene_type:complete